MSAVAIDAHVHVFRPLSRRYPRPTTELYPRDRAALAPDLLSVMSRNQVTHANLVALSHHDAYLAECLHEHPATFSGIGVLDSSISLDSAIERAVVLGLRGIRVGHLGDPTRSPSDLPLYPSLKKMADRGLILWFYSTPDQLDVLNRVLHVLPGLTVVLNHLGFCPTEIYTTSDGLPRIPTNLPPATLPKVLALASHAGVNVMLSGEYAFSHEPYPFRDLTPVVRAIYDRYGPERMLWGSDYPWISPRPGYDLILDLPRCHLPDAPAKDLESILTGTAKRLLRLTAGATGR